MTFINTVLKVCKVNSSAFIYRTVFIIISPLSRTNCSRNTTHSSLVNSVFSHLDIAKVACNYDIPVFVMIQKLDVMMQYFVHDCKTGRCYDVVNIISFYSDVQEVGLYVLEKVTHLSPPSQGCNMHLRWWFLVSSQPYYVMWPQKKRWPLKMAAMCAADEKCCKF